MNAVMMQRYIIAECAYERHARMCAAMVIAECAHVIAAIATAVYDRAAMAIAVMTARTRRAHRRSMSLFEIYDFQ